MLAACGQRAEKDVGRPRRMQRAGEVPTVDRWGGGGASIAQEGPNCRDCWEGQAWSAPQTW